MIADLVQGLAPVGAPDRNRTCDLKSRSLALYPTELQTHIRSGNPLLVFFIIFLSKLSSAWQVLIRENNACRTVRCVSRTYHAV